jgi:hypothetical protein
MRTTIWSVSQGDQITQGNHGHSWNQPLYLIQGAEIGTCPKQPNNINPKLPQRLLMNRMFWSKKTWGLLPFSRTPSLQRVLLGF